MLTDTELGEYLGEIRARVCSHCVERPPGGPPCAPLGKACGVEMHLPALIDAVHEVSSGLIEPYLRHNREQICSRCALKGDRACPCAVDYLAVLLVDAIEAVDARRAAQN